MVSHQTIPRDDLFLRAHFPGFPLWPGALLLEAMAQTTAVCLLHARGGLGEDEVPILGAVDCRFLNPVFPGERIRYHTRLIRQIGDLGLFSVTAHRGSELVARGRISAGITRRSALAGAGA
jgi:3-hydroxyacyl-[acyl-carrier-protein] dehydratase